MSKRWCLGGCQTAIPADELLCTSCHLTLAKYGDENPDLTAAIQAWARAHPVADVDALLAAHAAFDLWLITHEGDPP